MANELIPFDHSGTGTAVVPKHISGLAGDVDSNIKSSQSIDQLSIKGKVWRRIVDGEETKIMEVVDGEQVPRQMINIVVLDVQKGRSRAYYKGSFEDGKNAAPDCASADGITPDKDIASPCAKTCATCPNSVKGSKITDSGKEVAACTQYKRLVVVPSGNGIATHAPMLLRLAPTSTWDKENKQEAKGWYAWDQYAKMLSARGCSHSWLVETKCKFDDTPSPKVLFKAEGWLDEDKAKAAKDRVLNDREAIDKILKGGSHDGVMGSPQAEPEEDAPAPKQEAKPAPKKEPKPKAEPKVEHVEAEPVDDDGFGMQAAPSKKDPPKPVAKKEEVKVVEGKSEIDSFLEGWDA